MRLSVSGHDPRWPASLFALNISPSDGTVNGHYLLGTGSMGNLLFGTIVYHYRSFNAPVCLDFEKPSGRHCFLGGTVQSVWRMMSTEMPTLNVPFQNVILDGHRQVTYHILLSSEPSTIKNSAA